MVFLNKKRRIKIFNVESAVIFNFILRISQIFTQLLLIIAVSKFFTSVELGYFYVLNSYAGMSIFFELGFANVIMQHAAHEGAFITRDSYLDPQYNFGKLSSLFRFTLKWYMVAAALFVVLIYSSSFYFFSGKTTDHVINWHLPLFILMLSIAISSFLNGVYSFLEGCLFIKEVAKLRFVQNTIFIILFLSFVLMHFSILAYGLAQGISLLIAILIGLRMKIFTVVKNVYLGFSRQIEIDWFNDVFPLQWRIALSAMSSYFIYQITDLFAFKFQGAVVAGKYGFTMSILNGIMVVAGVWSGSRAPLYAKFVANKDLSSLQSLFKKTFLSIVFTFIFLGLSFYVFKLIVVDKFHFLFYNKFLENQDIAILLVCSLLSVTVGGVASYCRANKQEPFLAPAVFGAVWSTVMAFVTLKYYSISVFCICLVLTNISIGLPWAYAIYRKSKLKFFSMLMTEKKQSL